MYNPVHGPRTSATLAIVGACVVVYVLQTLTGGNESLLGYLGALRTPVTNDGFRLWQVVTYGFLHGGVFHLLFNMMGLYFFGPVLEQAWGAQRFVVYYFVCLVGAAVVQLVVAGAMGDSGAVVGASGAVLGVLAAFAVLYPDEKIYFNLFIPIKAKYFVPLYAVLDLYAGLSGANTGIAHFAHLGGMLAGVPLALAWRRRR